MKKNKNLMKILSVLMMVTMIIAVTTGCGSGTTTPTTTKAADTAATTKGDDTAATTAAPSEESPSGTFTYWSCFSGDSATWDQGRVDDYMALYPDITVDLQFVTDAAGIKNGKLLSAIAGGTAPDLIIADDYSSAYSFAANGSFIAMDEYLATIGINKDDFIPAFQDLMDYEGSTYLVPQDSNVIFLYYSPTAFEEAGLDPENPPTTIEELDAAAEALTVSNGDGTYSRFGLIPWIDSGSDAFVLPYVWGSEIYNRETNKLNITDEPMVSLFTWMQGYAEKYDPEVIDSFTSGFGGMFSPDHPFMTGKVAMTITGNWFTNALRIYAPDVEYMVTPIPTPTKERYGCTTLGSNVFAMPVGCEQPELAAHFIQYCIQPEVNELNFSTWHSIPTIDAAFDLVSLTINGDAIYKVEREMANNPFSGHPALTKVSAELSNDMIAARDDMIYNGTDPLTKLTELQEKFQAQLDS